MKEFGEDFTEELLEENLKKPNLYIRINTLKTNKKELIKLLENQGVKVSDVKGIDFALRVENLKNIENNNLFKEGLFTVQDISSMMVGLIMNPNENSKVLDVCSAPGGKSTHIATLMNNTGLVVFQEISLNIN